MAAVYVGNYLVVDSGEGIKDMINCRKGNGYKLKIKNDLTDYLGCKIQK
jgi:hypothetical protein